MSSGPKSAVFPIILVSKNKRYQNLYCRDGHGQGFLHSRITLQPKTGCPLKLSRVELVSTWKGDLLGKPRLLLEEVLVRPAGGAHSVVCGGLNAPV